MVGGTVLEVVRGADKTWVNTVESHERRSGQCAIYVVNGELTNKIKPGDSLWWQAGYARWTPFEYKQGSGKSGADYDIAIKRIGFSGVSRPEPNPTQ